MLKESFCLLTFSRQARKLSHYFKLYTPLVILLVETLQFRELNLSFRRNKQYSIASFMLIIP